MMQVEKYCSENKLCWNRFIENAKNATFLFDRNFMDYHHDKFEDHSLAVVEDDRIVALLPANITADRVLISHQGLTYGGLIVSKKEKLLNTITYFSDVLRYLHENNIDTLIYKEIPSFYNDIPSDEQQYVMFLLDAKLIRRDAASTIKIGSNLPYQKRRIKSIALAKHHGVVVKEDNNYQEFWEQILIPNLMERHGKHPVHSLEEISTLHQLFPNNIRQFNAYYNGRIMGGTTIFEMPNVAHSQYFCGNAESRRNGSLDLLCETLIRETFSSKAYFNFGISNEDNGRKINRGLLEWKEGFGARTYSQNFYRIETKNYTLLENCAVFRE